MSARRQVRVSAARGAGLLSCVTLAGCQLFMPPAPVAEPPAPPSLVQGSTPPPKQVATEDVESPAAPSDTDASEADQLARKVREYTQQLQKSVPPANADAPPADDESHDQLRDQPRGLPRDHHVPTRSSPAPAPTIANNPSIDPGQVLNLLKPDSVGLAPYTPGEQQAGPAAAPGPSPAPASPADHPAAAPALPTPPALQTPPGWNVAMAKANEPLSIVATAQHPPDASGGTAHADAADPFASPAPGSPDDTPWEQKIMQRARDYPSDLDAQLEDEMLRYIRERPVPNMSALARLEPEDREIVLALVDGLANFRNTIRADSNLLLARKIKPLEEMVDRLRAQAELSLPTIALCSRVNGFGQFEPIASARFTAGRENELIVYSEVENFSSNLDSEGLWETHMTHEAVLYTETGMPVWPAKSIPTPVGDACRQRRHDYFMAFRMTLPRNITIGRYLLKLTVTDQQAHRVAEATTPIEMVADSGQ